VDEYRTWLKKRLSVEITARTSTYYESVLNAAAAQIRHSHFWVNLGQQLQEIDDAYWLKTDYKLFATSDTPLLQTKPFASAISKSFRKNVLLNKNWPDPPQEGWIVPENWFLRLNDLIRTLFIVKYADGVQYLVERITETANGTGDSCKSFYEARDEGYYAAHVYLRQPCEVPRISWDTETINLSFEIQVTTQLQEVIRRLLHKYYESSRESRRSDFPWQWDFGKDEFFANNLGHVLHYIEGTIVDLRKRQGESNK
jgi:hypothetical protein